jgi:hypothetical protein
VIEEVDLVGYEASGLPTRTMGRDLATDPEFFSGAPLRGKGKGSRRRNGYR